MVETSDTVKNTMEAACSKKVDSKSNDNTSENGTSSVASKSLNEENPGDATSKNKPDESDSNHKEGLNANGNLDSSGQSTKDSDLGKNTSEVDILKNNNVSPTSSESNAEIKSGSNDKVPSVNGEETKVNPISGILEVNSDTCELKPQNQDLAPVQSEAKTASNDECDVAVLPSTKASAKSVKDKSEIEEDATLNDQVDKSETSENKSESSENKSSNSNESPARNDSEGQKSMSPVLPKRTAPEANCEVADVTKNAEEASGGEIPNDASKAGTSSKKKKTRAKKAFKAAILNESGRSTRSSNNPDFAAKQRSFLNKVQNAYSSIKHLEAASSMSESESDEDISDSSYSDGSQPLKTVSPAEKKSPLPVEKRVVTLPPGLAEKLAEKSRALLTEKKMSFPFTIGKKKLAPFPAGSGKMYTLTVDRRPLTGQLLANGMKQQIDASTPVFTMFRGAKAIHDLDEAHTLLVPASSKMEVTLSRKRKASSSAEAADGDSEDCSSPSAKTAAAAVPNKKAKIVRGDDIGKESRASCDVYCWFCHREGATIVCKTCPRVYHIRCLVAPPPEHSPGKWVCPMCVTILKAESTDNRSRAMKMLNLDQFCLLLSFTVARMKSYTGSEAFSKPVDPKEFPMYSYYIVYPMDISLLERNIKNRVYGSTEAFLADASWILHNCAIFNSLNNKLTHMAKQMLKICRQEIADIENCPDCYLHAHSGNEEWFLEVCRRPHPLVWAKLKGFPFWPAKAMQCSADGMVDVRFFGAHDRAWVPAKECMLYNRSSPQSKKKKKSTLDSCIEELEKHVTKLEGCFGEYVLPETRLPLDPKKFDEQLQSSLPAYKYSEAMKMPIAFSNEALLKACEENLKAETTALVETTKRHEGSMVTDEDGDVTHSDSLQSDKEDTPTGRPTKRAKLARETAQKSTPKSASRSPASKGADRPRRETRKSTIVDRLTEKLALLDDDQSKTPPPPPPAPVRTDSSDAPSGAPMETDVSQTTTEAPEVRIPTNESEKPLEATPSPVKIEAAPEVAKGVEAETLKSTPVPANTEIPLLTEIKQEKEDSLDDTERTVVEPVPTATPSPACAAPSTSTRGPNESEDLDNEPIIKRRSITRAATAAATAASIAAKPKGATGAKSKGKGSAPAAEGGKKNKGSKGTAGGSGVSPKKKGQTEGASSSKQGTPRKVTTSSSPMAVIISSPQEKFTARKSVPGGSNPKSISLIKSSSLPPSMSASPTILSSAVRLQTSAPSQQSVQVMSSQGMPALTVAPVARNVSLLSSAAKTSTVTTLASSGNLSGGSVLLTPVGGSTPVCNAPGQATGEASTSNMPALSSAPTSAKSTVTTTSPLAITVPPFCPSIAGSHSAAIRSHASKLTEYFCTMIEDTIKDVGGKGNSNATIKALQLEFERLSWQHTQEMAELRHNTILVVEEIKKTFETEKVMAVKEAVANRTTLSLKEKEAAIIATKRKQWCAFCLKEALFYCCWNTSYCDYSCQQKHWPVHSMYCTQNESCEDASSPNIGGGGGAPKPLIIKTPTSANGSNPAVSATLMPVISARSSVSISSNSTNPTYVLATNIPSTTTTGSTILVSAGGRPAGTSTNVSNARPYVLPQNMRIRPNTPGQKVVLRQAGKPSISPGQQNQVVFLVNNQKK